MIQFDTYFSEGLKPPTRDTICFILDTWNLDLDAFRLRDSAPNPDFSWSTTCFIMVYLFFGRGWNTAVSPLYCIKLILPTNNQSISRLAIDWFASLCVFFRGSSVGLICRNIHEAYKAQAKWEKSACFSSWFHCDNSFRIIWNRSSLLGFGCKQRTNVCCIHPGKLTWKC